MKWGAFNGFDNNVTALAE
jgi:hypothetical protein